MTTNLGAPPLSAGPDSTADSPEDESRGRLPQLPPWLLRWVVPALALVFGAIALTVLRAELRHYRYHDIVRSIASLPAHAVLKALGLTLLGYLSLTLYDLLALRYVGKPIPPWRVALTSFIAYAFVQTLGFALLTGGAIRFRFWSMWGLTPAEIVQGISFSAVTFWLGVLTVAGTVFLFTPDAPAFAAWGPAVPVRAIGALLLAVVVGYLLWCAFYRRPFTIRGTELKAPSIAIAGLQLVVSTFDWTIAGAVLWTLTSHFAPLPFPAFLGLFVTAQIAGQASHVPGGLGVFDALMLVGLRGHLPVPEVLSALLAYRAIYYLIPFLIAVLMLAAHEARQRRAAIKVGALAAGKWVTWLVPVLLPAGTFIAGAILLFSGATPGIHERLTTLGTTVPLQLIEFSHFAASLTGAVLLVLARGLHRRLDAAWVLAVVAARSPASWPRSSRASTTRRRCCSARCSPRCCRRAAISTARPRCSSEPLHPGLADRRGRWSRRRRGLARACSPTSTSSTPATSGGSSPCTATRRAPSARRSAPSGCFLVGGVARLLCARRHRSRACPTPTRSPRRAAVVRAATRHRGEPGAARRQALLFSESGRGVHDVRRAGAQLGRDGRSGRAAARACRSWPGDSAELADRHGGRTVFYEVGADYLPLYLDLGLTPAQARRGGARAADDFLARGRRPQGTALHAHERCEQDGVHLRDRPGRARCPALLPELRGVSDAWLGDEAHAEKGFSLGLLRARRYLRDFPVGRRAPATGAIVAFANLWPGGGQRGALGRPDAPLGPTRPRGVMDYLFIELMLWGQAQGYRWFNLGMAPLSGLETRALAPLWHRVGRAASSGTASTSTTSRACAPTRRSSTRSGSRGTWRRPAGWRCRACSPTSRR